MNIRKRNNVQIQGHGPHILMFGNGFGCDQKLWRHVAPAFEKDFTTVLFDYIGTGGTDVKAFPVKRYEQLAGYAEDILEICHELKLQNVNFVGHSMSGMISLLAAGKQPPLFQKLIMVGASPCYLTGPGYAGGLTREAVDQILYAITHDFAAWARHMAPVLMGHPDRPSLASELVQTFSRMDPKIAPITARCVFLSDIRPQLNACSTSTVVLQCQADPIVPDAIGQYLHQQLKNSQFVIINGQGHYPSLSAPEELIQAIRSCIAVETRRKVG